MNRNYTDEEIKSMVSSLMKKYWHIINQAGGTITIPDPHWHRTKTPDDFRVTQRSLQKEDGSVWLILKSEPN